MNFEELSDAINILERAIQAGALDTPKNEKKLNKLFDNISKAKKLKSKYKSTIVNVAKSSSEHSSASSCVDTNSTDTESSASFATTISELIPMTNTQPPSDMFECDESSFKSESYHNYNLALTDKIGKSNKYNLADDADSDKIIILK